MRNERLFYGNTKASYLPEIQPNDSNVVEFVDLSIRSVFRVVDFRMHPEALVVRVVNLFGFPLTLHQNATINEYQRPETLWKCLQACESVPYTPGLGSRRVPTLRPYPHPSRLASWRLDREYSQAYPSPDNIRQSVLKDETEPAVPHR